MAFIGNQLAHSGRMAMSLSLKKGLVSSLKPAIVSTCSPIKSGILCQFGLVRPFAARSYFVLGKYQNKPIACACGSCNGIHTEGDKELVKFLSEEIAAETKAQKSPKLPKVEGFEVSANGALLHLTRKFNGENIKVTVNVNHTVDADMNEEINPGQDEISEMRSKPNFSVEIEKNGKILEFGCSIGQSFSAEQGDAEANNDEIFNIDELAIYEKERSESVYAVSGEIMDGYLYDLLMNYLEERGISDAFVETLIEYSTSYEHKQYISLLDSVKSFLTAK